MADPFEPALPYDGTEGFVDRPTSKDRARAEATSGRSATRQESIVALLRRRGARGATWREASLAIESREHHSGFTSSLSTLHAAGKVAALTEERDHCAVYVLPEYVGERPTQPRAYVRRRAAKPTAAVRAAADRLEKWAGNAEHSLFLDVPDLGDLRALIAYVREQA